MKVSQVPGHISKLRRSPPQFQMTFSAEGERYGRFFSAITAALADTATATVTIALVDTGTPFLNKLLGMGDTAVTLERGTSIVAESHDEIEPLLDAAFRDGNDFLFVPMPKPFVIFEDDGFTTFFANSKSNLNLIAQELKTLGVEPIPDWQCRF